jgi:hypothetical protein
MRRGLISAILGLCVCACAQAECPPGDLNGDCRTDVTDLYILSELWLGEPNALTEPNTPAEPNAIAEPNTSADLNNDGHVNATDLAILAAQWERTGCPVVINEVLAHAHAEAPDWIELHNLSSIPVDIGGWLLSDRKSNLSKYQFAPGTIIPPLGYRVLYENATFGNPLDPNTRILFAMSENGETLYLSSNADTTFCNCLMETAFGASATSYSFGRYRKSTGDVVFVTMSELTPGRANAYPLVGPVVINEIMYHPRDDADAEYVELYNISDGSVTLFDYEVMEPWRLTDDEAIDFRFPSDPPVTLEKGEYLLLVKDLGAVRRSVPAGVKVFEWGSGRLANQGELLRLVKPGDVDDLGTRYWIEVDRVDFSDGNHGDRFPKGVDPWPAQADGTGLSLDRLFPRKYGDDPNNWQATIATPGSTND